MGNQSKVIASEENANKPVAFAHDIVWVGLSLIFTSLFGIVTLPVLTKTFSTDIYGVWSQVLATVTLVTPLLTLQFSTAVVRFLAGEENKEKRRRAVGSMLLAILVFAFLVFTAVNFLALPLSRFLFASDEYVAFVRLTFLWTFIDSIFIFFIAYLRARGKIKKLSIIQVIFILSKILIVLVLPLSGFSLEWVIICIIIAEVAFTGLVFFSIFRDIGVPFPNTSGLSGFLAFSAPQIPSGILLWIINASDRYFITHFLGLSQTGIYSSSWLLASVITLFYAPIGYVLLPTLSVAWERQNMNEVKSYLAYSNKLFLTLAIPAAVGITLISQPLLQILATSEFLAGKEVVLLVAVGAILHGIYQINLYVIYLVKQTKWMPLMIMAASIVSIGLNFILIPRVGIVGAAISNISAYFVLAAIVTVWANKALRYNLDYRYLGKVLAATAVMGLSLGFMNIDGILDIAVAVILATAIIWAMLFLLNSFSRHEEALIKKTFGSFIPWLR